MISDATLAPEPILRNKKAQYLDCSETGTTEAYELMGVGFTQLDENPGAQEYSQTYINQVTSSSFIRSYQTEFPYNCDMIPSENAVMALYKVGRDHLTGAAAMFRMVDVDLYNPSETANEYPARRFIVSAVVSGSTGNGGEYIANSGTLKAVGDPVQGTFNTSTKAFTPTP